MADRPLSESEYQRKGLQRSLSLVDVGIQPACGLFVLDPILA
jgi:hypothetical protein